MDVSRFSLFVFNLKSLQILFTTDLWRNCWTCSCDWLLHFPFKSFFIHFDLKIQPVCFLGYFHSHLLYVIFSNLTEKHQTSSIEPTSYNLFQLIRFAPKSQLLLTAQLSYFEVFVGCFAECIENLEENNNNNNGAAKSSGKAKLIWQILNILLVLP
jgi:hypothetical protein